MSHPLFNQIKQLVDRLEELAGVIDTAGQSVKLADLKAKMTSENFWQNQNSAKDISQKASLIEQSLNEYQETLKSAKELFLMAEELTESTEITDEFYKLKKQLTKIERQVFLNQVHDDSKAIVSIYAGAGGVDAQDWAEMLLRMYLRLCEAKEWTVKTLQKSMGQEAGIKSITLEISGPFAYGLLKSESGVHRLVRISPFNADKARHTSFAMVEVVPELAKSEIEIKPEDLRIDVYRSGGKGGQSVNTTDSAVRITHLPTGIVTICQNERSQHQNKEIALAYLYGKLAKYMASKEEAERQALRGELTEAAWGNQIRSYVLHPYKMVKDHRTNYEESDPEKVLAGQIDGFIDAYLQSLAKQDRKSVV